VSVHTYDVLIALVDIVRVVIVAAIVVVSALGLRAWWRQERGATETERWEARQERLRAMTERSAR
jgi:hypothetical protein